MNEFNFSVLMKKSQNYTPNGLMLTYAKQHPSTSFGYDKHGRAYLLLANVRYFYNRWRVIAVSPNSEMVTVYLNSEVKTI
ncbi:MAG: hypothetical protein IJW51_02470 [Clostridia bacterium]|nr:hypothetical protein [Clostridia bacterium]